VRLLHLANFGSRNIGNGALILGLERVLAEDFATPPQLSAEPWDDYSLGARHFDESFVERVNTECDALLVGAAVTFDGRPRYASTGMRFDLPLELWPRIRKPMVFYGLSHRDWRHAANYQHLDSLKKTIETMVESANVLFSVRNDGTKAWLEELTGVASAAIVEVPDPAVYVPIEDGEHLELEDGKTNLLLALNDEIGSIFFEETPTPTREPGWRPRGWTRLSRLWAPDTPAWERRVEAVLAALAQVVVRLADEVDLNVVLVPHDHADIWPSGAFLRHLPARPRQLCVFANTGLRIEHTPRFYDLYAKCDAAVSLRVHSMNPAVGIGAPVVPVVSQRRMTEFMRDAGLEQLCVSVRDPELADAVYQRVRTALERPAEVRAALEAARISLRERTARFDKVVEDFVKQ
jgi:polysaccharide pyruvyl transferase WcaK-like protein